MADHLLLTLDLGTTNCKAVAFTRDGTVCAKASAAYPTLNPREGWYEQRLSDWRRAIASSLASVGQQLGLCWDRVAGLGLSAWGPGLVLLDANGVPLNQTSPTWQDVRSLDHGRQLVREVGADWVGGGMPLTGFPAKLAWATEAWPAEVRRAAYAAGVKDYILSWLTGALATDPSSGPFAMTWPAAVFRSMGWDCDRLPPVARPTTVVGRLRPDLAAQFGLPPKLPIVVGLNDGAAATLGVGAHREGDAVVSLGTNGVFRLVTARPVSAEACLARSLFRYPLVNDVWACGGFVLAGGSALAWLADTVAAPGQAKEIDDLLREAAEVPAGSEGIIFLPYLVGRGSPHPDPDAAATFLGLRLKHRRSHLARAVLEGVAFGVKDIAEALASLDLKMARLFVTGGGAASSLWRGIMADILELPAGYTQGDSNLGAAVVLAVALGLEPDVETAVHRMVRAPSLTMTTRENLLTYQAAYQTFRTVADKLTA